MEETQILQYFEGKTILITGATGFLAKIFVEKILRLQPNVKKIFLVMRASANTSVEQRLQEEVVSKELFGVVREMRGEDFNSFISSKLVPIQGDVACQNLGIVDDELRQQMWREIHIIVNSAATTKFDERYDVSFGINTMGAMHVQEFGAKCSNLEMFLHVSTAKNQMLNCLIRARLHGWPNTYVFTKAMGEMMLANNFKQNCNVVIIRPTIITSTFKDPFPGWIEGVRTMDSVFVGFGKGKLRFFVGDPGSVIDLIPGDMVVNCMVAAIASHSSDHKHDLIIHQIGSSRWNPVKIEEIILLMLRYLGMYPFLDATGKPLTIAQPTIFNSMHSFHDHIKLRNFLLLKILGLINVISSNHFESSYTDAKRSINHAMRLAELYEPYLFSKEIYDDGNTEKLRMRLSGSNVLNFDPKCVVWDHYLLNTHFPGLLKYVLK